MTGTTLPTIGAFAIVTGRSLASSDARLPRPYELASTAVIYTGAGLLYAVNPGLGLAVAWGYLVALMLVPSSGQLLTTIAGGINHPAPGSKGTIPTDANQGV